MRIIGLLALLLPYANSISRHPVCSDYGLNWAAEIRCLRNILNKCHQYAHIMYPKSSTNDINHMSSYYGLPNYFQIRNRITPIDEYMQATSTASPTTTSPITTTPTTTSSTSTTTTTTSAPPIIPSVDIEEIRSTLLRETIQKFRALESRIDVELRAVEERCNSKVEAIRWEADNEIRKLNKTIRFMTRRVYRFGRAEYIYVDGKESWYGAEEQCVKWGGHLASITDAAENKFIRDIHKWFAWIGFNDIQKENKYVWSDGSNVKFTNWKKGECASISYRYLIRS
ncbi:Brevican core protein [Toxocara canis]|uniref:Brevican core protein n=1 Tax=Toxocara canis TaxID=6265 RepID=A0A0B2V7A2_TOXCA|nr:Brevican core protein [Toxocara canis]